MKIYVTTRQQYLDIMHATDSRPFEDLLYWWLVKEGVICVPLSWRLAEIPYHIRAMMKDVGLFFMPMIQPVIDLFQ